MSLNSFKGWRGLRGPHPLFEASSNTVLKSFVKEAQRVWLALPPFLSQASTFEVSKVASSSLCLEPRPAPIGCTETTSPGWPCTESWPLTWSRSQWDVRPVPARIQPRLRDSPILGGGRGRGVSFLPPPLGAVWPNPAAAAAKSLQSCPILCDPTDGSPPGSPVPGILQARTLEWVAFTFSNAGK